MDGKHLVTHFGRIGARVRVREDVGGNLRLNILRDKEGQYFDILGPEAGEARVLDVDRDSRHLLLLGSGPTIRDEKRRFLCGFDEREWFVCAVPGRSITNVRGAIEALKPSVVQWEQRRAGVRTSERRSRRTSAYIRQGEWFFVPRPNLTVPDWLVLANEPLRRGSGKPHWAQFLYRTGGQTVMVSNRRPNGITLDEYKLLVKSTPEALSWGWRSMRRNPTAYVKGTIRHPDHATIRLDVWHLVAVNTESEAPGARNVAFLD